MEPVGETLTKVALIRVESRGKSVYISCRVCTASGPSNGRKADKDRRLLLRSAKERSCCDIRPISIAGKCSMRTYVVSANFLTLTAVCRRQRKAKPTCTSGMDGSFRYLSDFNPCPCIKTEYNRSGTYSLMVEVLDLLSEDKVL
jgi:hypothetical protein